MFRNTVRRYAIPLAVAVLVCLGPGTAISQPAWPNKPIKYIVPGFEMQSWQCVFAPAGTLVAVVDRLAKEIAAILATAEVQEKLRTMGVEPDGRPAAHFSEFQQVEMVKWAKVIKEAGIQAE
jgi:tripartite-type tricarboxylate transporter receptor subunit TctC